MALPELKRDSAKGSCDLRTWLGEVDRLGQLENVSGVHWDLEIGGLSELVLEKLPAPPALLFDDIPGYPRGWRVLVNMLETVERTALTLGLPADLPAIPFIDALRAKLRDLKPIGARTVSSGPVLENIQQGDRVDLLRFPTPRWHEGDGGRYLGTALLVVTRDPENGMENVGCYRVMVQDKDKLGLHMSPGKHGRIHLDKATRAGKPLPVAMVFGQHPLLYVAASMAIPITLNEYDWASGMLGEPIELVEAPLTKLRIPAYGEIAIEGEILPGERLPEGPFGEWPGYYTSANKAAQPVVRVKAVYHRNDPIICGAPPFKPTIHGMYRSLLRSAFVWNAMEQAGVPEIKGVYLPPPAQRFMVVVAIRQKYPGHAKQAAVIACQCQPAAYLGRYVVVVDEDIDITNLNDVVWAMCTRTDPATSVDIIRRAWSGPLDPIIPQGQKGYNSRMVIDATRPYEWRQDFPAVSEIGPETRKRIEASWRQAIELIVAKHASGRGAKPR
ncbi:MAG TPA: UbiD family decarboxylase [Candidatus Acidoferrales bacterium]|nr:UbiD family decarboxylase [Candidatus Acidoferrales bacterium]